MNYTPFNSNKRFKMDTDEMEQLAEALLNYFNSGNFDTRYDEYNVVEKFIRWHDFEIDVSPTYYNDDGTVNENA